jgi:4-carboxymuconolactone decarboxylase
MSDSKRRARGLEMMEDVMGFAMEPPDLFTGLTVDAVFGDIWGRPGLTRKERRWISLTLAAVSGQPTAYVSHLRAALTSGDITRAEIDEWLAQFAHYAGWPIASGVYTELRKLDEELAEQG